MLRSILFAALIAGTLTGILSTAIQHLQVIPLIQWAEQYETDAHANQHDHASSNQEGDRHDSSDELERNLFTLLSNVLAGIGFAMLLASAITLSEQRGWRKGLLWGLAGYFCFFVAPGLGLTPKLPGTAGAALEHQQIWWIATVVASVLGLGLIVFAKQIIFKVVGLGFVIMPYVVGAPLPELAFSAAPETLQQKFIIASSLANAGFWIILGTLSGYLLRNKDTENES